MELSLLTPPCFPSLGPRQLLGCHLIAKALGRSLSLLLLSKRTPRTHFSQDPVQKKAVFLSRWWLLSYTRSLNPFLILFPLLNRLLGSSGPNLRATLVPTPPHFG